MEELPISSLDGLRGSYTWDWDVHGKCLSLDLYRKESSRPSLIIMSLPLQAGTNSTDWIYWNKRFSVTTVVLKSSKH
jgi:hypothetical protein